MLASWREATSGAGCETWIRRFGLGSTGDGHGAENVSTSDASTFDITVSCDLFVLVSDDRHDLCPFCGYGGAVEAQVFPLVKQDRAGL